MNKLITANLLRIRKSKSFWGGLLFMVLMAYFVAYQRYYSAEMYQIDYILDNTFFTGAIFGSFALAIFCSLYFGTEYSEGTMRNKVIAGHTRNTIYLANLTAASIVAIVYSTVFFLIHLGIGFFLEGRFDLTLGNLLLLAFGVYMLLLSMAGIYTLIGMLVQNKSIVSLTSILTVVFLVLLAMYSLNKLTEPEMIPAYTSWNGSPFYEVDTPNPEYVEGTRRKVHEFILQTTPGGQMLQFTSIGAFDLVEPERLPIYSGSLLLITIGLGIPLFYKKDLK